MTEEFKASVQYNDWQGTAAADDSDQDTLSSFLRAKKLISDDELVIGIQFWNGENHGGQVRPIYLHALVSAQNTYEKTAKAIDKDGEAKVRNVDVDLPVEQFFGFFKRFSIAFSRHGVLKRYEVQDSE